MAMVTATVTAADVAASVLARPSALELPASLPVPSLPAQPTTTTIAAATVRPTALRLRIRRPGLRRLLRRPLLRAAIQTDLKGDRREPVAFFMPDQRPRYGATPVSGSQIVFGGSPVCQNTSIGMPPRGYQYPPIRR